MGRWRLQLQPHHATVAVPQLWLINDMQRASYGPAMPAIDMTVAALTACQPL
jgi:hypothetical protein